MVNRTPDTWRTRGRHAAATRCEPTPRGRHVADTDILLIFIDILYWDRIYIKYTYGLLQIYTYTHIRNIRMYTYTQYTYIHNLRKRCAK
jgi:hypothetical protein